MKEEQLDELIALCFEKKGIAIDFSQDIMKEIEAFENKKYSRKRMCGFIIGFFTILSSVFSIVFIELLFRFYCYYLRIFVINMQIIKYCLEGFFIMAIFFIVVVILKYKDLRLSENNLPSK